MILLQVSKAGGFGMVSLPIARASHAEGMSEACVSLAPEARGDPHDERRLFPNNSPTPASGRRASAPRVSAKPPAWTHAGVGEWGKHSYA
jgi:hypothetical protein